MRARRKNTAAHGAPTRDGHGFFFEVPKIMGFTVYMTGCCAKTGGFAAWQPYRFERSLGQNTCVTLVTPGSRGWNKFSLRLGPHRRFLRATPASQPISNMEQENESNPSAEFLKAGF